MTFVEPGLQTRRFRQCIVAIFIAAITSACATAAEAGATADSGTIKHPPTADESKSVLESSRR